MTKTKCCFPGCSSGSQSERKKNKLLGVRYKSLFRAPRKDSPQRDQWQIAMNLELDDNDVVCELHFTEEDIIKNDVFNIKQAINIKHILPRERKRLKPTAIPSSVPKIVSENEEKNDNKSVEIINEVESEENPKICDVANFNEELNTNIEIDNELNFNIDITESLDIDDISLDDIADIIFLANIPDVDF